MNVLYIGYKTQISLIPINVFWIYSRDYPFIYSPLKHFLFYLLRTNLFYFADYKLTLRLTKINASKCILWPVLFFESKIRFKRLLIDVCNNITTTSWSPIIVAYI